MKTKIKSNVYLFVVLSLALFAMLVYAGGCGKSEKEAKMNSVKESGSKKSVAKTLAIDTSSSTVNWLGKKVTGEHNGTVKILKGEAGVGNDNSLVNGNFEINMNTITDLDLEDEEWNAKLINHLKSEDFFSVEKFPTSKFEITNVEPLNDASKPNYNTTIYGNLTIKGITKGISFPASVKFENGVLNAFADFDIDRTQWDIKYGSGKFFENLGDKMINDNFNIKFKITAK